jgi:hypothetical protein
MSIQFYTADSYTNLSEVVFDLSICPKACDIGSVCDIEIALFWDITRRRVVIVY